MSANHIVKMVRNSAEPGGRDHFSCSGYAWALLLEIGVTFGWKSLGSSYVPGDIAMVPDSLARHGYQPGDQQDSKLVDGADAIEWAKALSEARASPHLAAMIGDQPLVAAMHEMDTTEEWLSINAPFVTTMDEFIAFAYGGEFTFSRSP